MRLTIEKTGRVKDSWGDRSPSRYQLFLHTKTMKIEMGLSRYAYADCLNEANHLIFEFKNEKVLLDFRFQP